MLHPLDTQTPGEAAELMTKVLNTVRDVLPPQTGFIVIYAPMGDRRDLDFGGQYGSNIRLDGALSLLHETAIRVEHNAKAKGK